MQAVIIDDDKSICPQIQSEIKKISIKIELPLSLTIANSVNEILSLSNIYDIYFIDIEMPGMNGLELVQILRKKHVDKDFVFISSYEKYMRPAFFVKPTAFVRKEYLVNDLEETLKFIKTNQMQRNIKVQLQDNAKEYSVCPYEIMYCVSDGHYIALYSTSGNSTLIRNMLRYVEECLKDYDFIRIHSRYLINLNYVEYFSKKELTMRDGKIIPISDSYRENALKMIMLWFMSKNKNI